MKDNVYNEFVTYYERLIPEKEYCNDKVPVNLYFRGCNYFTSRCMSRGLCLSDLLKEIFPNAFDKESGNILEKFEHLKASIGQVQLAYDMSFKYIDKAFCYPNGYCYIVVDLNME